MCTLLNREITISTHPKNSHVFVCLYPSLYRVYTIVTVPEVNVLTFIDAKCNVGELYAAKDILCNSTRIQRGKVRVIDIEGQVFFESRQSTLHAPQGTR